MSGILILFRFKRIFYICLAFSYMLTIFSCENQQVKIEKPPYEEISKNEIEIREMIKHYDAIILDDTIEQYTFRLQDIFIKQNKLLSVRAEIFDAYQNGNLFTLKIMPRDIIDEKIKVLEVIVDSTQQEGLKKKLEYNKVTHQSGCFIIKVSNVISLGPEIEYKIDNEDQSNPYISSEEENKRLLSIKGRLIDYKLEK
ncbi:hypothetical protein ACFOW1_05850 [Parasediminibacterium paludis]|uniref:Uncharacterized protein n=1 Tax=Parasediminibacterium paludis TaxID=908966 RepID=A0ABV8PWQ2_9BACT